MSHEGNPAGRQLSSANTTGKLFVVGTPIGNLEDITFRAVRILKEVDLIACEDTRHSQKLFNHYSIQTRTISYHEHNEMTRAPELIIQIEDGSHVALVSDAGMPGISDPGFRLVQLAIRHMIPVVPVPGASAFVAALAAAGLPMDRFRFLGFLPSKTLERRKHLKELESAERTLVLYESPHRLVEMLEDVRNILGNRPTVIAREVTKLHEEFVRGSVSEVIEHLMKKPVKGEITVLLGAPGETEAKPGSVQSIREEIYRVMADDGMDEREALKIVARRRGIPKSQAYREWQLEKEQAPRTPR
jgi:16S rRNA (cytidine1402-2'-O)-methyltransferase